MHNTKPSQKDRVLKQLRTNGQISRNECLRNFITRLSAYILDFRKEGMEIEAEYKNGDYIYKLLDKPKERIEYRVNGELVHTKLIY